MGGICIFAIYSADSKLILGGGSIFYLGRIHHYLVYDAFQRDSSEKKNLLSVFVCRILFQLYHTIRQRWTAHADLLYEKREDFHSGVNGDTNDRDDYL